MDFISAWEVQDTPIHQVHLDWANSVPVGKRLASSNTSDVVDAHLAVTAESLGTFILTWGPDDMTQLDARYERY